jgi:hypothetical protein
MVGLLLPTLYVDMLATEHLLLVNAIMTVVMYYVVLQLVLVIPEAPPTIITTIPASKPVHGTVVLQAVV